MKYEVAYSWDSRRMIERFASPLSWPIGLTENALICEMTRGSKSCWNRYALRLGSLGGFDVADILLDGLLCKVEAVATDLSHFSHF